MCLWAFLGVPSLPSSSYPFFQVKGQLYYINYTIFSYKLFCTCFDVIDLWDSILRMAPLLYMNICLKDAKSFPLHLQNSWMSLKTIKHPQAPPHPKLFCCNGRKYHLQSDLIFECSRICLTMRHVLLNYLYKGCFNNKITGLKRK